MSTSRAFAINLGAPVAGTEQIGDIAIGTPTVGFAATGLDWWNGPDEELGYVIAGANPTGQTGADGRTAYLGFNRSDSLTDASFIGLAETLAGQSFLSAAEAKTWLNTNGYWTSWTDSVSVVPTFYIDASDPACYSGSGTIVNNIGSVTLPAGTLSGVGYDPGIAGGVFDFDGVSDRMNFSGLGVMGSVSTFSGWVYPRSEFSINTLVSNASANQNTNGFKLGWNSWNTQNLAMWFEGGNGSAGGSKISPINTVVENEWQMLTYVVDFDGQEVSFYRNGEYLVTATGIVSGISYNNLNLFIGHMNSAYNMDANLGELKIWNSGLDVNTITAEYNATKSRYGL